MARELNQHYLLVLFGGKGASLTLLVTFVGECETKPHISIFGVV